jgi:hypothetical protein
VSRSDPPGLWPFISSNVGISTYICFVTLVPSYAAQLPFDLSHRETSILHHCLGWCAFRLQNSCVWSLFEPLNLARSQDHSYPKIGRSSRPALVESTRTSSTRRRENRHGIRRRVRPQKRSSVFPAPRSISARHRMSRSTSRGWLNRGQIIVEKTSKTLSRVRFQWEQASFKVLKRMIRGHIFFGCPDA